jgi:3',5'-nucleoside bisphosphate phosphatase
MRGAGPFSLMDIGAVQMTLVAANLAFALMMLHPASAHSTSRPEEPQHGSYEDHGYKRAMHFPDAPDGSRILSADLHTHSVFSDGHVWPSVRVEEADRDGVDALALTEHLEHQPKSADIPHPDRNRAFQIAVREAATRKMDAVMLINGAEITRDMPPGHVNAVFLEDANKLLVKDAVAAISAANEQGAFLFWNHPNWLPQAPDGVARIFPFHLDLIRAGKLHGVEVANGTLDAYSEHALAIALEHNLAILGTSDIHGLIDWTHNGGHGGHRPLTLVLSKERSPAALKQALFDRRTVAWINDDLIGRSEHVEQVFRACMTIEPKAYVPRSSVLEIHLVNNCPLAFTMENAGIRTFHNITDVVRVERYGRKLVQVRMNDERETLALDLVVLNTQVRPRVHLRTTLNANVAALPRPTPPAAPALRP